MTDTDVPRHWLAVVARQALALGDDVGLCCRLEDGHDVQELLLTPPRKRFQEPFLGAMQARSELLHPIATLRRELR